MSRSSGGSKAGRDGSAAILYHVVSRITKMDGVAVTLFDGFLLPLPDVP